MLAFYEYPAEHWQHLRTTVVIESTFATVRHRTTRTRNCVSRSTFLGLAFKLIEEGEKTWRRINGPEKIKLLLEASPSRTASRCKTIGRFSTNSPLDIDRHDAAHTPLFTLALRLPYCCHESLLTITIKRISNPVSFGLLRGFFL